MGLPKILQIPCHHVLGNQNYLKFKKGAPLKQFFNINLGIGVIKKLLFLFVFLTYLPIFLLKFGSGELVGLEIKFCIQWALPIEIWVKTEGDMLKIWTKKVVFLWYLSPNLY